MDLSLLKSLHIYSRLAISVSPSILRYLKSFFSWPLFWRMYSMRLSIYFDMEKIRTLWPSFLKLLISSNKSLVLAEQLISSSIFLELWYMLMFCMIESIWNFSYMVFFSFLYFVFVPAELLFTSTTSSSVLISSEVSFCYNLPLLVRFSRVTSLEFLILSNRSFSSRIISSSFEMIPISLFL